MDKVRNIAGSIMALLWLSQALAAPRTPVHPAQAAEQDAQPPVTEAGYTKEASLDWDAVASARAYEIELTTMQPGKNRPQQVSSLKMPHWRAQLAPGEYALRLRTIDSRGVPGTWSEPQLFNIPVPEVIVREPQAGAKLLAKEMTQQLVISWNPVKGITRYRCQLLDASGNEVKTEDCVEGRWEQTVEAARSYQYRVMGLSAEGYINPEEPAATPFTVVGPKLDTPSLKKDAPGFLSWQASSHAAAYHVVIKETRENQTEEKTILDKSVTKPTLSKKGFDRYSDYKITVIARAPDYQSSEPFYYEIKPQKRPPPVVTLPKKPKMPKKQGTKNPLFAWLAHEVAYGYVPLYQYYHVNYPALDSSVRTLFYNSHLLQARWSSPDHALVASLTGKRAQRELTNFGTSGATAMNSSGLTLKLWSVGADVKYFFSLARFKLGGGLGMVHKNFYTFREGDPLMVTPISSSVTEIMTGVDVSLALSPTTSLMGDAYYGHHFAATGLNVKGAQHYTFSGVLQHATMVSWLFFSYFYRYDFVSDLLDYSGSGKSEEITAIIKSYQIGAMVTCQF